MQIWAQEVEVGIGIAICTSGLVAWGIRESIVSFAPKEKYEPVAFKSSKVGL